MNENNSELLQEFVNHLRQIVDNNFESLFKKIPVDWFKPESHILKVFVLWHGRYCKAEKDEGLGFINRKKCVNEQILSKAMVKRSLDNLDKDEIADGVLENFKKEKELNKEKADDSSEETNTTYSKNNTKQHLIEEREFFEKKIVLDKIDIVEIVIPADNDILNTGEKRYEFKRRMTNIQTFLTLGDYIKALEECEYIFKNLELQSGQLHEYHTIAHFRAKGSEHGLIQDIQNDNDNNLKQLILCIERCRLFIKNRITTTENSTTVTFEDKVNLICYRISMLLRECYRGLPEYNYVNYDDNKELRKLISQYMKNGLFLLTEIYPKTPPPVIVFIADALIELNGGRRLEWLDVTDGWQIRNKDGYPALEMRDEIANILKDTDAWEACRKRLYNNLSMKYVRIKVVNGHIETRQSMRRFFKACIIAHKCFNEDVRFIELLKEELLHQGKLTWFDLDNAGKLIPNAECHQMDYDPRKDLARCQRLSSQFPDFQKDIDTLFADLKREKEIKRIEEDIVGEADRRYDALKLSSEKRDIYFREQVVECLELWQQAYEQVKFDRFIDRVIKELIGKEGLLFWFQLNDNAELINHTESTQLGFDAVHYLNDALDKSADYYTIKDAVWKDIRQEAAQIMEQEANSKYEQL